MYNVGSTVATLPAGTTINVTGLQGLAAAPANVYRLFTASGGVPSIGAVTLVLPPGYAGILQASGNNVELAVTGDGSTQFVWTGAMDGHMGNSANWQGLSAPAAATTNANLIFPALVTGTTALIDDMATNTVNSITFTGGNYSMTGS